MNNRASGMKAMFLKAVRRTMDRHRMIEPGDRVLAGVSGGPDSVALVHILKELASEYSFDLAIGHLNHRLRGEASDRDEAFTASLAEKLNLPFHTEKTDVQKFGKQNNLSTEHAARRVRYDFFHRISEAFQYSKIALGHQSDDNAEMVLMAMIRGSGPHGLAGIPPVRDGRIIRPLFHLSRSQILSYLEDKKLGYVTDESNLTPDYLRNKIRLELIPLLERDYNPRIAQSLNRLSEILRAENQSRKIRTEQQAKALTVSTPENSTSISTPEFAALLPAEKRSLVREMVGTVKGNLKSIHLAHVDAVIRLADSGRTEGRLDLPDKILVRIMKRRLFFSKEELPLRTLKEHGQEQDLPDYLYEISGPGSIRIQEIHSEIEFCEFGKQSSAEICSAGQEIAFFDIKSLKYPLILRNSRPDDRFVPLGMTGSQAVRKFLKDHGIKKEMRHQYPVLLSNGKIIWVVGQRIDESVKVSEHTHGVLKAHFRAIG